MAKHKQKMEAETNAEKRRQLGQKIDWWNKALTEVAGLKGEDVKGRKETEFIEEIVTDIHQRLGVPVSNSLPLLIGMEYHVKSITAWLKDGSCSHTVDILTIASMGGIGKTSLAKYVYGLHCRTFHKSNFIENINRYCTGNSNGIRDLQKQLHGDIPKTSSVQFDNVSIYTVGTWSALARKNVFIVLDDIDSFDQLDDLLGKKVFPPGSKIIITTRDTSLTEKCGLFNPLVKPRHTKVLLKGLYETASLKLLCLHAFKCPNPKEGYKEVSKKLVKYCEGHPLALEVLGKSLRGRDVAESIPSGLPMKNLVALEISHSKIESFDVGCSNLQRPEKMKKQLIGSSSKDKRLLGSLKILDLSFCEQLRILGGFLEMPSLERLIVRRCISLIKVSESIEKCLELALFDLSYCYKLKKIPSSIGKLKKFKTLLLEGCHSIRYQIEIGFICLPRLLVELTLEYDILSQKSSLMDLSYLSKLKYLYLYGNAILSLPDCVRSLRRFEIHDMNYEMWDICKCTLCRTHLMFAESKNHGLLIFFHDRTIYIEINCHFTREKVMEGLIEPSYPSWGCQIPIFHFEGV